MLRFSQSAFKSRTRKTMHDKIITGVTVTHVSRESLGALSSRTAVVLRVKISNISKKKKKEKEQCCIIVGNSCCLRLCGRREVDSAERGVGN